MRKYKITIIDHKSDDARYDFVTTENDITPLECILMEYIALYRYTHGEIPISYEKKCISRRLPYEIF